MDYIKELAIEADRIVVEHGNLEKIHFKTDFDYKNLVSFSDHYKKILLSSTDNVDVFLICWLKYQSSGIHNHPDKGCAMILLEGLLSEIKYRLVDGELKLIRDNLLKKHDRSYNFGSDVLHKIEAMEDSISLHVYHKNFKLKSYFI